MQVFIQGEGKGKNAFESRNVLNEKHSLEWNLQTERVQTTLTEEERGNLEEEEKKKKPTQAAVRKCYSKVVDEDK